MNSDKVAIALTLGISAVELVILLSKGVDIGSDFIYLLYGIICYGLFQGMRPIADVITGKDYIRHWDTTAWKKIYKSSPIEYMFNLGSSVIFLCLMLYFMFGVLNSVT